jgi:hypothetical protein
MMMLSLVGVMGGLVRMISNFHEKAESRSVQWIETRAVQSLSECLSTANVKTALSTIVTELRTSNGAEWVSECFVICNRFSDETESRFYASWSAGRTPDHALVFSKLCVSLLRLCCFVSIADPTSVKLNNDLALFDFFGPCLYHHLR